MVKIQTYKFVNPGVAASANPATAAARSQTLAFNRLGRTVSDIAVTVADIEKVAIISKKDAARRELLERRQKQRERDAAAEEAAEQSKLTKKKPRLTNAVKAGAKKSFGFITQFLKPIGNFLAAVGAFAITKEVLEWFGNEENKEKLRTFLEKAQFVFDKLFGWAKTLVQTTLDGLSDLFGDESIFKDRLIGLGKVMLGITALKYLMNPFGLISDIIFLSNALLGRGGIDQINQENQANQVENRRLDLQQIERQQPAHLAVLRPDLQMLESGTFSVYTWTCSKKYF